MFGMGIGDRVGRSPSPSKSSGKDWKKVASNLAACSKAVRDLSARTSRGTLPMAVPTLGSNYFAALSRIIVQDPLQTRGNLGTYLLPWSRSLNASVPGVLV